jgi:hypothetical protein
VSASPSGSEEPEPSSRTTSGAAPDVGVAVAWATGGRFGGGGGTSGPLTTTSSNRQPEVTPVGFPVLRTIVATLPAETKDPVTLTAVWRISPLQPPGFAHVSAL